MLRMGREETSQNSDSLKLADFRPGELADDRRREPRISLDRALAILPCDRDMAAGFHEVKLVDCSVRGIGIQSQGSMDENEKFLVKVELDNKLLVVYVVRNCRPDRGEYRIGAELTAIVGGTNDDPDVIFKMLLGEAPKP